jgi:hypothetical protein
VGERKKGEEEEEEEEGEEEEIFKLPEKQEQAKHKLNTWKELIKIRTEIHEVKT